MKRESPLGTNLPRYRVVAQALIRDIERGRYQVGDMLPTEAQLCEQFGVSRYTVREAIRRLTDAGLITRRAGVGTTVKARAARSRYTASVSDLTELFAFTRQTHLQILSEHWVKDRAREDLPPDLAGRRWLCFTALRFAKDAAEPLAHVQMLVHPAYEAIRDNLHKPGITVYRLIEDLHGERIVELRQQIGCTAVPRKVAGLLGVKAGSPALRVLRYYYGANEELFSVAINTYPQDRVNLTTRWQLDWNADSG